MLSFFASFSAFGCFDLLQGEQAILYIYILTVQAPTQGHFCAKRSLLGLPGALKGPDTRSKCMATIFNLVALAHIDICCLELTS